MSLKCQRCNESVPSDVPVAERSVRRRNGLPGDARVALRHLTLRSVARTAQPVLRSIYCEG
jgi:hypothetical protein